MTDIQLWMGLIILTILLYSLKWWHDKARRVKVYRVSPESLKRSKQVMMAVLPLIEDGHDHPIDRSRLRYAKEDVKSAAKIMAYYFWLKKQHDELTRVKDCFVGISRFQDSHLEQDARERLAERERKQLERELEFYMTHSPFNARKKR